MSSHATTNKAAARQFVEFWKGKGYEKGQTQPFWLHLLRVLGVETPEAAIEFEDKAHIDAAHGFIDGYIPETHVLVEQKSLGKSLRAGILQSDGSVLNPFQQAKRYAIDLPYSRRPRWVVTCNFAEFLIYDMEKPNAEPESLLLQNLPDELYRLKFLTDSGSETIRREEEISKKAGEVVGLIYDALLKQYRNPDNFDSLKSLNELCVRIVFLLYAEDADVFTHLQFHDYLARREARDARRALIDLFKVLDTPPDKRDPYLEADLAAFPYVNGGLFANENLEIPQFTDEILDLILRKGSEDFNWKDISPTIFGAVFESTLNPETRRSGGMHYTSIQNIHKVIDPLFLDGLRAELAAIKEVPSSKFQVPSYPATATSQLATSQLTTEMKARLRAFIDHLASLTFLDPACGSGNFLTETYICLRRLENEALATLLGGQTMLDLSGDMVKVSLSQFHGIEINDFAVKVAKTALWIAESQMLRETEAIAHRNIDFLPLKSYDGIVEGNALRMDWDGILTQRRRDAEGAEENCQTVKPSNRQSFSFIIGNPPFVGARLMSPEQKADLEDVFGADWKGLGNLDYVAGWYKKSADLMTAYPATRTALVSTNSVCQGDAVATLWKPLAGSGVSIDFAHRTFRWDSESNSKAHVHCVIVGFSCDCDRTVRNTPPPAFGGSPLSEGADPHRAARRISPLREGGGGNAAGGSTPCIPQKPLFDGERVAYVPHINAYLLPGPDAFVESRSKPLCAVPEIGIGSQPIDDGQYLFTPEEKAAFLVIEPAAEPFFHPWLGSQEFINKIERWCLWLGDCPPNVLRAMPRCMERVAHVREFRLASKRAATRKSGETPSRFGMENIPKTSFILVPKVSSERRRYVPMGFIPPTSFCSDLVFLVPDATLYHFGVLTSNVHMAWMRAVAGRLKSDYRYSAQIVYNNFPWPEVGNVANVKMLPKPNPNAQLETGNIGTGNTPTMATLISSSAQAILDVRARYPDASLADLYDELTMPPDLRKAHQENDRAVMAAYGFSTKMTESECVAELFKRYQALVTAKGSQVNSPTRKQDNEP